MSGAWGSGSTRAWRQVRTLVLARDGYVCQLCHHALHPRCSTRGCARCAHVDHITPKANGGSDHPANLRAACQRCNLARSSHTERGERRYADGYLANNRPQGRGEGSGNRPGNALGQSALSCSPPRKSVGLGLPQW